MPDVKSPAIFGILAEFRTARDIYRACTKVRDAGFKAWDAHTPFPVHGLEKAMGLPRSRLPWVIMAFGMIGAGGGMFLQWWINVVAYPLVIAGKPFFSWQAFIPVTFELGVLFAAFGAVMGMLHFSGLPRYYHPVFRSDRFEAVTNNRFFISIEAADPKFDAMETAQFLKALGATYIEMLEQ